MYLILVLSGKFSWRKHLMPKNDTHSEKKAKHGETGSPSYSSRTDGQDSHDDRLPSLIKSSKKKSKSDKHQKPIRAEDYLFDDDDWSADDGLEAMEVKPKAKHLPSGQSATKKQEKKEAVLVEKMFDGEDQTELCEDEYHRFLYPSAKVGHALIGQNEEGQMVARQFTAPGADNVDVSEVIALKDIKLVEQFGALRATAIAPDGTKMVSKRSIQIGTNVGEAYAQNRLFFFSPEASHLWKGKVWWGSDDSAQPDLFRNDLTDQERADLEAELEEIVPITKGSTVDIVHADVPVRSEMKRKPDQNGVMKRSAIDAYEHFYDEYKEELSPSMRVLFEKSIAARPHYRGGSPKTQPRPEWLHAIGFGLTPLSDDPQQSSNLGSAPKWLNTKMMVTERALRWHALHRPDSKLTLDVKYDMLLDTDLIKRGYIEGTLKENNQTVVLKQDLNPFAANPNYHKTTDIMQTTLVAHKLLQDEDSTSVLVAVDDGVKRKEGILADYPSSTKKLVKDNVEHENKSTKEPVMPKSKDKPKSNKKVMFVDSVLSDSSESTIDMGYESEESSDSEVEEAKSSSVKSTRAMPTAHRSESSVVQIYSTFQDEDYQAPWKGTEPNSCTGSGFVYERNGKHYLLTNAHVVESSAFLQVRLANDDIRYTAKPVKVSYQSDIALLEVTDPEFIAKTVPIQFGDMVNVEQRVRVVGFPMGGEELSTTKGIISRIQVDEYVEGGETNLQAQTDSAINPGNSGGPVFSGDKVVGIAFQGIGDGDGLGYIIPMPVIQHFLDDYFSPGPYQGFPSLNFAFQTLDNPDLRRSLSMTKAQSGVRVTRVDNLSEAFGQVKEGDILLEVDGIKISNDGKANIPDVGSRIDLSYLFQRRQMGEKAHLKVLRTDPVSDKSEILDIDVTLKFRAAETKMIESYEFEKSPTYYTASGILFQPLTANYLMTPHGRQIREMVIPQYGYINDVPKTKPDQQLVIINRIFDSEYTKGYDFFENNVVKKINGQEINHIKDVVKAMESNPKEFHSIEVSSGELLAVKNLSGPENQALLKRYRVEKTCSDDLLTDLRKVSEAEEVEPVKRSGKGKAKKGKMDARSEVKALQEQMARLMAMLDGKAEESSDSEGEEESLASLSDHEQYAQNDEDEYDYEDGFVVRDAFNVEPGAPIVAFSAGKGGAGDGRDGLRTFQNRILDMERRYGAAVGPQDSGSSSEDESFDSECSASETEYDSDSESTAEEASTSSAPRRSARLRKRA